MKNKERYAKEIVDVVCGGDNIAVTKEGERVVRCRDIACSECLFVRRNCMNEMIEWAESEYIEKPVISKRDRTFLDYLTEEYKFIARDKNGELFIYKKQPRKGKNCSWIGDCYLVLHQYFNVDFPMIKWKDYKSWFIEDLKKLELVEEYD